MDDGSTTIRAASGGGRYSMKKVLFLILILVLFPVFAFAVDVTLEWDTNTEPGIAGYYVYQADRFEDKTGPWQRITPDLVTEVIFIVTGLDNANYAWQVTAIDASGNESFVSNMVERFDRTPPLAPGNLRK